MKIPDTFIEDLFNVYYTKYDSLYSHLTDVRELELISFTYGVFLILKALKIDTDKIKLNNKTLQEEIDIILKGYLKEDLNISNEEKLHAFVYDKDNVSIRKYVSSGEGG